MTTTNGRTNHSCAECGRLKPVVDRWGHQVNVHSYDPPDGGDDLVMISGLRGREGDETKPCVVMLTYEMAERLAIELASIAEGERQFRLETRS